MAPEQLREVCQAIKHWSHPVQVHITGGEPFLRFDLLLHAVHLAVELGIPRYVETNAGWCVTEELVQRRLVALRDAGLQALLISCSPFHAETIPLARTRLAFRKALEILGRDRTILYLPDWLARIDQFDGQGVTAIERYVEDLGPGAAGRLLWQGYGLIGGGRSGYRLGHLADRRPATAFRGRHCRDTILYAHHSHMDLYGNYIPGFCGGLALGDWHTLARLRTEYQAGRFPPLVDLLIHEGPWGLFEMARQRHGYVPLPDGYVDKCHLCVDIRQLLNQVGEFRELRPSGFYDAF
jgi:hypothetical protein